VTARGSESPAAAPQREADRRARCRALLEPRSIAVVGASDRPGPGQRVVANLIAAGFSGALWPINPRRDTAGGIRAYPSLDALPSTPDLVVLAVNREITARVLAEAVEQGVPAAILLGAGFGEVDGRGRELDRRIRSLAPSIAMMGPNCLGYMNLELDITPYSGPLLEPPVCGNVALVSNSGALACTITGASAERGIRFSHVITTGNQIDLSVADYVRYLAGRPAVNVIACYLEGFGGGRDLLGAFGEARAHGKTVILLKAGRSRVGGEAAQTHTGALAGSASIQDALWHAAGLLPTSDLEEFLALIELSSRAAPPAGPRIGIITISGGERLLLADQAEFTGIELAPLSDATRSALREILPDYATASNPLDSTGAGLVERDGRIHAETARLLVDDPSVDLLLVCQDIKNGWVQEGQSGTLFWDAIRSTWEAVGAAGKPVIVLSPTTGQIDERARTYLQEQNVPMLYGLTPGMKALAKYIALHCGAPQAQTPINTSPPAEGATITGREALRYLAAHGVPVGPAETARSEDEAVAAAQRLGYPVALKIDAPGLLHRTEIGGVRLDLHAESDVRTAWRELVATGVWNGAQPAVLVQPMIRGGIELFAGGIRDEQFGPILMAGAGGVLAEFIHDIGVALAPLDIDDAARLIDSTRVSRLLNGWRGAPPADRAALLETLTALSRIIADPRIQAIDANPVIALPTGVTLVDAKIVLNEAAELDGAVPATSDDVASPI